MVVVAELRPTMAGMPSSLTTMAAWLLGPPEVTIPPGMASTELKAGVVGVAGGLLEHEVVYTLRTTRAQRSWTTSILFPPQPAKPVTGRFASMG